MTSEYDLDAASVPGLLRTYRPILDELLKREIIRTRNAPTGDYAE